MAFEPIFEHWAGLRPLLKTARTIIERDMEAALDWSFGDLEPGPVYARIQYTQRHSQAFPLLVLQAASSTPEPLSGGVLQRHVIDCEIYLTRSTQTGEDIDTLAQDLIRYLDATMMCFLSAPATDWTAGFPAGADAGKIRVWCTNIVFGQLQQATERSGQYLHSVAFELQIDLIESE